MVAGSILPVTIHNDKLYFLFGKESPMEDSAKGWSDFGGRVDPGETPYIAALREGGEEMTGFLGDDTALRKRIKKNGGTYNLEHNKYHVHIFYLPYDENLPKYYNQNHAFLWERMDKTVLSETKLFEKIEIDWFAANQLKKRKPEFREFYQEIVDLFIEKEAEIHQFILKKSKHSSTKITGTHNRTKKHSSNKNK
jgi:8-oxo-dGTP pyrophosphatase MutT (NUDIX family)